MNNKSARNCESMPFQGLMDRGVWITFTEEVCEQIAKIQNKEKKNSASAY